MGGTNRQTILMQRKGTGEWALLIYYSSYLADTAPDPACKTLPITISPNAAGLTPERSTTA